MGGSSGSDVDGSDLGEFLDDFASDSDDGEIAQETADSTRAWTILTAPSESAAAAAAVYAARTAERGEDAGSDDEQLPWRAQPEPLSEPAPRVGDCAISPLAAIIATLDGSAARNLLAQSPDLCPPQWQPMLLSLCDGDYLAVLSAAPARELLGLPVCAEEGDPAGEADGASATAEELRQRGNQLYKDAEYAAAAKSYTDAARVFKGQDCAQGQAGGRELCLLNRAACYLKLGHSLAAVADCNAVLLAQPESVKALFRRGQAFANVGNLARAKTDLAAAAKLSPKDAGVRSALADCKARLKAEGSGAAPPANELAYIREMIQRVETRIGQGGPGAAGSAERNQAEDEMLCLCTAIALLLTFVQANWTAAGSPSVTGSKLSNLIRTPGRERGWAPFQLQLDGDRLHKACLEELTVDGETASVNTQSVQCFLLSQAILRAITAASSGGTGATDLHSAAVWWKGRSMSLHQRLLEDCPSSTLDTAILGSYEHIAEVVAGAGASFTRKCGCDALSGHDLEALPHLELAVYAYTTRQRPLYRSASKRASEASGIQWSLDGMLGVRTKYQTQKKAQLIIRHTSTRVCDTGNGVDDSSVQPPPPPLPPRPALFAAGAPASAAPAAASRQKGLPAHVELDDDTLLPEVRLESDANFEALALDQAIILLGGMAAQILENVDETLRNEQLRAFTRLITAQKCSLWCIQATAFVQRSKIESYKRRTIPRALEQLRSLVKEAKAGEHLDLHTYPREAMFFGVPAAPRWSVQRDEALGYCKEGIFELAAEIFLEIQAWHDVIDSYTAANEILKAENIVRTRLSVEPSPRLWCALGELCERSRVGKKALPNDSDDACSCYKHALSLDPRYGHAHRCLAKLAWSEERFEDVILHLDAALAINPMSTPSWYTLGCTALRLRRWQKARTAFTRFLAAEPDDGEGHANLAVALIHLKQKEQAYAVLSDAVRHAWGNGKVWQNYVPVCIDTGHFNTAVRAIERLIAMKFEKEAIDISALRVLVTVVESNGEIVDVDGVSARRLRLRVQSLLEKLQLVEPGKEHVGLHAEVARFHAAAASFAVSARESTDEASPGVAVPEIVSTEGDGAGTKIAGGDALLDQELTAAAHHQRRAVSLARQLELISRWPEEQLEDNSALDALATLATTTTDALLLVEKGLGSRPESQDCSGGGETMSFLREQVRSAIATIRKHGALITKDGGAQCFMVLDEQLARLL